MVDLAAWAAWLGSLDNAWLFVVVLGVVIGVVVVWSSTLHSDNRGKSVDDEFGK